MKRSKYEIALGYITFISVAVVLFSSSMLFYKNEGFLVHYYPNIRTVLIGIIIIIVEFVLVKVSYSPKSKRKESSVNDDVNDIYMIYLVALILFPVIAFFIALNITW